MDLANEGALQVSPWFYAIFTACVLVVLTIDLTVFHRRSHVLSTKEAAIWSAFWVSLAGLFWIGVTLWWGTKTGLEFLTGYVIELSLSVDNVFVFLIIFTYFSVPQAYRYRVLFYGIVGAIVMRAVFIAAGVTLLAQFHWIIFVFGGFLVLTGIRIILKSDTEVDPSKNPIVKLVRRFIPVTDEYHGQSFFVRIKGVLFATPLFLVLVSIEVTDLVFAIDSVPAVLAITDEPFIVYTSNIFAILGLRSFFFLISGLVAKLRYLKFGLGLVLVFVGVKMTTSSILEIPILFSLGAIVTILAGSVIASLIADSRQGEEPETEPDPGVEAERDI
ncbi:TerC family protein [bacterium AH-315-D21]|nr:TerC family protein [bacterium AH-315-D21]